MPYEYGRRSPRISHTTKTIFIGVVLFVFGSCFILGGFDCTERDKELQRTRAKAKWDISCCNRVIGKVYKKGNDFFGRDNWGDDSGLFKTFEEARAWLIHYHHPTTAWQITYSPTDHTKIGLLTIAGSGKYHAETLPEHGELKISPGFDNKQEAMNWVFKVYNNRNPNYKTKISQEKPTPVGESNVDDVE